ncbi:hypothetical protein [Streptomyces boninensis]|uniref:hypothetical protein n=1 Tax=Streptomyces boninensis TaxID=2039455 RepID=UPI003B224616
MKPKPPRAVIFDDTALLALGAGTPSASRLVVEAETDPTLRVYIPALCLTLAEAERAGVADHVSSLPSVDITPLDFPAITAVAGRARDHAHGDWGGTHALHLARPSVEWPLGRPVLTRSPTRYRGTGVRTIPIPENA